MNYPKGTGSEMWRKLDVRQSELHGLWEIAQKEGWEITPQNLRARLTLDQNISVDYMTGCMRGRDGKVLTSRAGLLDSFIDDYEMRNDLRPNEVIMFKLLLLAREAQTERDTETEDWGIRMSPDGG